MKNDALNHFKEEMNKRGLFRKIQVCANLIPPPPPPTLAIGKDSEILGSKSSFLWQYATKCGKLPPCPGGCFPRA